MIEINFNITKRNSKELKILTAIKNGKFTDAELSVFAKTIFMKHLATYLDENDLYLDDSILDSVYEMIDSDDESDDELLFKKPSRKSKVDSGPTLFDVAVSEPDDDDFDFSSDLGGD